MRNWREYATATSESLPYKLDTLVDNNGWIGQNVTMLSGVKIGHGSIIVANIVITKDVVLYRIVGRNSATQIKIRFDDEKYL